MKNRKKFFLQKVTAGNTTAFAAGTVALLALAWLGDQSYYLFFEDSKFELTAFVWALITFVIGSSITAYLAFDYIKVKTLSTNNTPQQAKVLVMSVSPLYSSEIKKHDGFFKLFKADKELMTFSGIIEQDIASLEGLKSLQPKVIVNWQQTLRAINQNIGMLEQVVLVYSKELTTRMVGDASELNALMDWLNLYTQRQDMPEQQHFTISRHSAPVNKDQMKQYYTAFDEEIDNATANGIDDKDIIVDVTGGQVPASVGGSLATLHNNCAMQYINNDGETFNFAACIERVGANS